MTAESSPDNALKRLAIGGDADVRRLFEVALAKAIRADPGDAPFPLDHEQAALWHRAQASTLQWVLEMLPT